MLKKVLESWRDLLSLNLQYRPTVVVIIVSVLFFFFLLSGLSENKMKI